MTGDWEIFEGMRRFLGGWGDFWGDGEMLVVKSWVSKKVIVSPVWRRVSSLDLR